MNASELQWLETSQLARSSLPLTLLLFSRFKPDSSPPLSSSPQILTPRRSPRLVAWFLLATGALLALSAGLTIWLTTDALERRVEVELLHTSRLLGGSGFPLNDVALTRVAEYVEAEVVVLDRAGQRLASSEAARADAAACAELHALASPEPRVWSAVVGGRELTIGAAPLPPGPAVGAGGQVYVLYPGDLIAAEARQAWLPLLGLGALAVLLAGALGIWAERRVQAEHTLALVRLLASVAHEVRNPLGGIRSLARGLAGRRPQDAEELELIASEAERLAHLADSLRAVGLPVRTQRRPVEPDALVASALKLCAGQLEHRRVAVEVELGGAARVMADPDQVRQVVLNLVLNAADAQPAGGRVRLQSVVSAGSWALSVTDAGPGVAPELKARLFEPFVSGKAKGLGVGLYLSRRLAEANGARLELAEGPEALGLEGSGLGGARFVLTWPLESASSGEASAEDDGGEIPRSSPLEAAG